MEVEPGEVEGHQPVRDVGERFSVAVGRAGPRRAGPTSRPVTSSSSHRSRAPAAPARLGAQSWSWPTTPCPVRRGLQGGALLELVLQLVGPSARAVRGEAHGQPPVAHGGDARGGATAGTSVWSRLTPCSEQADLDVALGPQSRLDVRGDVAVPVSRVDAFARPGVRPLSGRCIGARVVTLPSTAVVVSPAPSGASGTAASRGACSSEWICLPPSAEGYPGSAGRTRCSRGTSVDVVRTGDAQAGGVKSPRWLR